MPVIIDGTNGVNTPNTFAFKNRLINAQLLINQRGVSGTVTLSAGAYGHDRFKAGASGCTYTFATTNNVTTLTITAGSLQQVIEGLNLESGTYTLSWTGTVQGKIGAGSYGASGITGSITGGTNTTIEFNTGTLSLPQLEVGSTATSFDYRPYGTELVLCQRYYYGLSGSGIPIMIGQAYSTSAAIGAFVTPTEMRAIPTLSYNLLNAWTSTGSASSATTWTIDSGSSNKLLRIGASGGSGLVAGNASGMYLTGASSYFNLSAEL
jgi:hypothetical protein